MIYFKVAWASPKKHEHWYRSADGKTVELGTCILNEPGAQCVAPMWDKGDEIKGARVKRIARLPQYAMRRFEFIESFR